MSRSYALPFTLRREDMVLVPEASATTETVHGLLRFDEERLMVQWRVARETWRMGREVRKDHEMEPVQEVSLPLAAVAGVRLRWLWSRWPPGRYLVLTGADLRAFEGVTGKGGLQVDHPAELVLRVNRSTRLAAREFAGELALVLAERTLRAAEEPLRLEGG